MILEAIILAAGEGVRMRSTLPKALHPVGGRPMLAHVVEAANALEPAKIHLVVGRHGDAVRVALEDALANPAMSNPNDAGQNRTAAKATRIIDKINWVTQKKPLGTGHAAQQAMPAVNKAATVLLLYGDTPLISASTLRSLIAAADHSPGRLGLLTAEMDNPAGAGLAGFEPTGLGRIVRDHCGKVVRIVEEKDADDETRKIRECNTGFIAAPAAVIAAGLAKLENNNAQKEFYLTDIVAHAAAAGVEITTCHPCAVDETLGVNSQADLARVERIFQGNQARDLLEQGVRLRDPSRFDLRGRCEFGRDCVVDVNVILEGRVVIGDQCVIGANAIVRNSRIGAGSVIEANCVIDDAVIGARCTIGPFARLRPQTELDDGARIGNFVEIKKSRVGRNSKINHLSYVGDSDLGTGVNIGAGVITCNYDGAEKHRTVIGDDVFVGSNSQLVAPLVIGDGATIGAGSTITESVAGKTLAVGRARQTTVDGWARPAGKPKSSRRQSKL